MRKNKSHILFAWTLLFFFAAGQYMVFAHQHKQSILVSATKAKAPILKEKCDVCDVMHHTHMLLTQHVYFTPAVTVTFHYQYRQSDVKFIQLIIAAGRAPPVIS